MNSDPNLNLNTSTVTAATLSSSARRNDDPPESVFSTVRRVDEGLTMGRRWVEIIIILIGFGVVIGQNNAKFSSLEERIIAQSNSIHDLALTTQNNQNAYIVLNEKDNAKTREMEDVKRRQDLLEAHVSQAEQSIAKIEAKEGR